MPPVSKPSVVRDAAYLRYLRTLPCHFQAWGNCNTYTTIGKGPSEVSHLDGKSRDDRAVSCCGGHHRTNRIAWHSGQRSFCQHYQLDKDGLLAQAEANYKRWQEAE